MDRNGIVLAGNKSVSTISVIHNQIKQPEKVIKKLSEILDIDESEIRKKVEKVSSREKIKSNVDKEISDRVRNLELDGVMVDEDYKRTYPFNNIASKVIGFTGICLSDPIAWISAAVPLMLTYYIKMKKIDKRNNLKEELEAAQEL